MSEIYGERKSQECLNQPAQPTGEEEFLGTSGRDFKTHPQRSWTHLLVVARFPNVIGLVLLVVNTVFPPFFLVLVQTFFWTPN